jgi:hypothetical protein
MIAFRNRKMIKVVLVIHRLQMDWMQLTGTPYLNWNLTTKLPPEIYNAQHGIDRTLWTNTFLRHLCADE